MELINHVGTEQILLGVEARDKWDLLEKMLDAIMKHPICKRQTPKVIDCIRSGVIERERDVPTYMGHDFALPHARIEHFRGCAICIAVLKTPLPWTDKGDSVSIASMVLASEEQPTVILKVMSSIVHLLADKSTKRAFVEGTDPKALFDFLEEQHINLDVSILARDIMRTSFPSVKPATPLRRVTHRMFVNGVETIAVVDDDGVFHGDITCSSLLRRGLPDFFNQLASVSFVKDFDPFEKYFAEESHSTAADVATQDCATAGETTTLMEIVYLLAVKMYQQVYVIRNKKLLGTIDRSTVMDQILNL